jgi:Domain of Unknown Function (DUF1080)
VVTFGAVSFFHTAGLNAQPLHKSRTLYEVKWKGWQAQRAGWHFHGAYIKDGLLQVRGTTAAIAPYQIHTANYAVEAKIKLDSTSDSPNSFGVLFRSTTTDPDLQGSNVQAMVGGIIQLTLNGDTTSWAAFHSADNNVQMYKPNTEYDPGYSWHTYRVEVRNNSIRLFVDGRQATELKNFSTLFSGTRIGLYTAHSGTEVGTFKVTSL